VDYTLLALISERLFEAISQALVAGIQDGRIQTTRDIIATVRAALDEAERSWIDEAERRAMEELER